ncbi:MAG: hypothetical protein QMD73_01325 [Rhodocyclaceae bacterium]|nr:hypothetical protein [Rhodocyclaceae bacterium]
MKAFRWSPEKNETIQAERGVSFEKIVVAIESGGLLDILKPMRNAASGMGCKAHGAQRPRHIK